MRVETGLVSQGRKKKKSRKNGKHKKAAVQTLFGVCAEVFAHGRPGLAPSPEEVGRIRSVLDSMSAADVDLNPLYSENVNANVGTNSVVYLHVYECANFSIGIFCLPPSSVIPLHNHPGMTVFSKLLFGSMHIKSYDWADLSQGSKNTNNGAAVHPEARLAKVTTDAIFSAPCDTSILYPTSGGNIHCFTALTPCAVLDVLGPPYCDSEGRHCTYYKEHPHSLFSTSGEHVSGVPVDGEYSWLEEQKKPSNFHVLGGKYTGPLVIEN